jgi:hypothetical protein
MNVELLEQSFAPDQIKQLAGRSGQTLQYIEGHSVIKRLNTAIGNDGWSFSIISHEILATEVIVLGELTVGCIKKMQFGSVTIKKAETGEVLSIGTDLMAAATCSLKKCASMLGVGLYLYGSKDTSQQHDSKAQPDSSKNTVSNTSNTRRLSKKQHEYLLQLASSRGLSKEAANDKVVSQLGIPIHMLTKQEASSVIQQMLN